MAIQSNAVYESGLLRPLQPLDLVGHERVVVSVIKSRDTSARSSLDPEYIERLKRELGDEESAPGLEEVRRRLAGISESMAEEIVAARGDR